MARMANGTKRAVACLDSLLDAIERLFSSGFPNRQVATKSDQRWFAVRVKSRSEKAVAAAVRGKGFEEFLPLYKSRHRWSDRSKLVDQPLFPGYVFCRLNPEDRFALLTIPRVMHLVGIGNVPAALADDEILAIRHAVRVEAAIQPWPFTEAGQRVRLASGPLVGVEGLWIRAEHQQRIVLGLTVLQQSIAVEIERDWIGPAARSAATSIF
jgi:transcription antitermination factor NusG